MLKWNWVQRAPETPLPTCDLQIIQSWDFRLFVGAVHEGSRCKQVYSFQRLWGRSLPDKKTVRDKQSRREEYESQQLRPLKHWEDRWIGPQQPGEAEHWKPQVRQMAKMVGTEDRCRLKVQRLSCLTERKMLLQRKNTWGNGQLLKFIYRN